MQHQRKQSAQNISSFPKICNLKFKFAILLIFSDHGQKDAVLKIEQKLLLLLNLDPLSLRSPNPKGFERKIVKLCQKKPQIEANLDLFPAKKVSLRLV